MTMTPAVAAPEQRDGTWYVYLLECRGGRIYTGITPQLAARMAAHAASRGARFTRMHRPVQLLAARGFASRNEALREEHRIKQTSPRAKRALALQWAREAAIDRFPGTGITPPGAAATPGTGAGPTRTDRRAAG
nr:MULTISPECIES: GIY-YIG nuclease family protein [unclassified Thioalkalivibrio]